MLRRALWGVLAVVLVLSGVAAVRHERTDQALGSAPLTTAPYAPAQPPAQPAAVTPYDADGLPVLDPAWVQTTATATGVPPTALAAYARATLRAPDRCGLGWTTLAAIGYVESRHGTLDGRVLGLDGTSSTPVVGPALDGDGFAALPATALGTALHGDPTWDHAVGPMQFIPATWQRWAADGDGDGRQDPMDLDDAAWAAARYLCADRRDLTTGEGWSGAVLSYNRSGDYLAQVHAAATAYADRSAGTAG